MNRFAVLALMSLLLAGCPANLLVRVPGHLYPVAGPLSAQAPLPGYRVIISGAGDSGSISVTLQDGAARTGRWARLQPDDPSANALSGAWDRLYGAGYFVAHLLGNRGVYRAVLTGNAGTTLTVDFYDLDAARMDRVKGVAMDNNGNVFKLTF